MPLSPAPAQPAERTVLSVQFPRSIYDRIQAEARDDDRTPSYVIRKALAEHFERLEGQPIEAEKIRDCPRRGGVA
jgi:predicted transcriptional regulator